MIPLPLVLLLLLVTAVRLGLAIWLTYAARQKEKRNLRWLALYFGATFFMDIFLNINVTAQPVVHIGTLTLAIFLVLFSSACLVGDLAMIMFIQRTFYQERKSPRPFFVGTALFFFLVGILLAFVPTYMAPLNFFIWGWLAVAAYRGYRQIAADKSVEDWVKARYQLTLTYALMLALIALLTIWQSYSTDYLTPVLNIVTTILAFVLECLVWIMPQGFRRFLNRKYVLPAQPLQVYTAMSEEEIMRHFDEKRGA